MRIVSSMYGLGAIGVLMLGAGATSVVAADAPAYFARAADSPVAVYVAAAGVRPVYADGPVFVEGPVEAKGPVEVKGMGRGVGADVLAGLSGGADVSEQITLSGNVSNNTADHVATGFNAISAGSFDGASGIPTVIQNTGNNVLIQNATIINVQFKP
jgi:hypothetical protein